MGMQTSTTQYRERLAKARIKKHEGFRAEPYKDSLGFWTTGWGHRINGLEDYPYNLVELFEQDFAEANKCAVKIFPYQISDPVYIALVDMAFNLGCAGLRRFRLMIAAIDSKDWKEAARQALDSRWAAQVGQRAIDDADLISEGDCHGNGC